MGRILRPRYEIAQTCWFWRGLFGLKWAVVFKYGVERETRDYRYAVGVCELRGRYKTISAAEKRMRELEREPEWRT